MKALLPYLFLSIFPIFADAAERSALADFAPTPMITASQALRAYVTDAHASPTNARSAELAIVSLSEQLIVERWRMIHPKDPKSRDAVLAAVEELEKGVAQLFRNVSDSPGKLDPDRLKKLKASIDTAVADFRLRLKTTLFQ